MNPRWVALIGLASSVIWLGGCSGDPGDPGPPPPAPNPVVGNYQASELTIAGPGQTFDVLGPGGSLGITLSQGGATSGRFLAPGLGEDGEDLDESMAGTPARRPSPRLTRQ